jgi:hypothetical protein
MRPARGPVAKHDVVTGTPPKGSRITATLSGLVELADAWGITVPKS